MALRGRTMSTSPFRMTNKSLIALAVAIALVFAVTTAFTLYLNAFLTSSDQQLEHNEMQYPSIYQSYDMEALENIPPTPEGYSGGLFSAQWNAKGTVVDLCYEGDLVAIAIDQSCGSAEYLSDVVYLEKDSIDGTENATQINTRVEIRFLPSSDGGVITCASISILP